MDKEIKAPYAPKALRDKWQACWDANQTFRTPNPGEPGFDAARPKNYILDFFPYPSGAGLHVGHPEGYTATDILARYRRMRGFNVLHTMGWDAFGLPAEQHAIETGQHPAATTEKNVNTFRRQLKMLGFSYDWRREISTTDPAYFKWTQWIFLQIFNSWYDPAADKARPISELPIPPDIRAKGDRAVREYVDSQRLAYMAEVPVNWCPALGTVLANEEVTNDGRSERGDHPVFKRPLKQWMMRITKYADRLANDLEELDWPESIKLMQRNWIGRSEGAQVRFKVDQPPPAALGAQPPSTDKVERASLPADSYFEIFTTRPDTLFGATYMVLAPEHPLVAKITTPEQRKAVDAYVRAAANRSELARTAEAKEKTGVFTGAYAINPVNDAKIPIWIADYVLMSYGTGAIMAVPAHDERDFEFAKKFNLPITQVIERGFSIKVRRSQPIPNLTELILLHQDDLTLHAAFSSANLPFNRLVFATKQGAELFIEKYRGSIFQEPQIEEERTELPYTGGGRSINSGWASGMHNRRTYESVIAFLEKKNLGAATVQYKLRDWLFSRQRYWGEPFPILHGPDGEIVPLDESELPLTLPDIDDFRPTVVAEGSDEMPAPPLGRAKEWATITRNGKTYRRELNTMPQWAGSCWYYLRFTDPWNKDRLASKEAEQYWMLSRRKDGRPHVGGIDMYMGGAEHAVLHLLYARFWHKVLYDLGHVSTIEPFGRLFNQGMIRAFAYRDARGAYHGYEEIDFREDGTAALKTGGEKLSAAVEKMSKSLKNVINPEEVVNEYGADTLRLYEMFMGPLEASKPWNPRDVPGVFRFLQRAWRMLVNEETGGPSSFLQSEPATQVAAADALERLLHKTIKKVGEDIERLAFNTAISAMMEFVNEVYRAKSIIPGQAERFVLILAPFAPHLAEELWQRLRGPAWKTSLACEPWPAFDPALVEDDQVEIPVQVNGKVIARLTIAKTADEATVKSAALAVPKVTERIGSASIAKTIYVPGRMLNLVVK